MSFEIDRASLLVHVPGAATLASVDAAIASDGYTLAIATDASTTVADWLAAGAPGAASSFADPADHVVAGLTATLTNGRVIEIRPAPRRAVGPDLVALVLGAKERFATVDHAWLRVHRRDAKRVAFPLPMLDLDPPVTMEEAILLDAIAAQLR